MPAPTVIAGLLPFLIPVIGILTALPLARRKVPPNVWYGFRTRRTLSNRELWYEANYLGGLDLLYANVIALLVNLVLEFSIPSEIALPIQVGVVVVASVVALVLWARQMKILP